MDAGRLFSKIVSAVSALTIGLAVFGQSGAAHAAGEPVGDPIAIGFNAPLSGPVAGWGLPGLTGIKIWMDAINAEGGLLVDGTRRPLELYQFDNEFIPSKALQGAKQLVLEHDVKIILDVGGSTGDAQIPFLMTNNVFYSPLTTTDINATRPYVLAGFDYFPRGEMMRPRYIAKLYPDLKRFGVISQEEAGALIGQAWEVGAAKALGYEIVYDEHFAADTTDFAPVVTALLAQKPEVISLNITWPEYIPLIMKQLYLQGFEGPIAANYIEWENVLQHVPAEWAAKVHGYDSYPTMDDPWWGEGSIQHAFAETWIKRFGPGGPEETGLPLTGIDWLYVPPLEVWAHAVQKAGTTDAAAVLEAIHAIDEVSTLEGPTHISGEAMFGIDNMISAPVPTNEFNAECKCKRIVELERFEPWFEANQEAIIAHVREKGQMWDQRQ